MPKTIEVPGWQVGAKGGRFHDPVVRLDEAIDQLRDKLRRSSGPFRIRERGETLWGPERTKSEALARVEKQASRFERAGQAMQVATRGGRVLVVRKVTTYVKMPPIPDAAASPGIKRAWRIIQEVITRAQSAGIDCRFVYLGIYNCRRIDGSTSWSQHSRRRALDWIILVRGGGIAWSVMDDCIRELRAAGLTCETLWQVSGHFTHAHVGDCPAIYSRPPCADA